MVLLLATVAYVSYPLQAKVKKLIEIWERSNTFPTPMLASFKERVDAAPINCKPGRDPSTKIVKQFPDTHIAAESTTPDRSPPAGFVPLGQQNANLASAAGAAPALQQDTSAILEALKNMAKQNASTQPAAALVPPQPSLSNMLGPQNGIPQSTSTVNQGPAAANGQAVNPLGALFAGLSNGAQSQSPANVPQNPLAAFLPPAQAAPAQNPAPVGQDAQAQLQLLQLLAAQGIPPDQWATALQLLSMQNAGGAASGLPVPPPVPANNWAGHNGIVSRDQDTSMRSPPSQFRRRSRSPGYDRRREVSPRGRRDSPGFDQRRSDGRGGNMYRQRSPVGRKRRSATPPQGGQALPPPGPKFMEFDPQLPKGHIKVLSRTLFVGGVTSSDFVLRQLFEQFGIVQTCIVNVDKRHAFVKMLNRTDALKARNGMEEYKNNDMQLRVSLSAVVASEQC